MNKHEESHNNINTELNDDALDSVSGGWDGWSENLSRCPFCHRNLVTGYIDGVLYKICPNLQNHFKIKV